MPTGFFRSLSRWFAISTLVLVSLSPAAKAASPNVVISQVFGGGGNSGANLNHDYIELFNRSSAPVTLNGYSIQYASATGTSTFIVAALPASITLQPGQFYLIQGASGTNGSDLPVTPDTTISTNLSGTQGKVALVSGTTQLSGACPTDATIVDFVGYGSANCSEGNNPAPATSATLADIRKDVCVDTDNNGADFAAGTPNPHNTASTLAPCGGPVALGAAGAANPASIEAGTSTLLTATVTPATDPTSTGITATADLSAIGGSATQTLYDDGTNGDVTAGDNVFSYAVTVPDNLGGTTQTLPVAVADAQGRTTTASIALTITPHIQTYPIHTIQGDTPNASPYTGQTVRTTGIVTGVRYNGFFIQARDSDIDSDPATPEGMYVYTGSTLPAAAVAGNEVQVTGKVSEYPTTSHYPGTELDSPAVTVLSTGNAMPAPITITANQLSPSGNGGQLLPYESMRISISSLTTTSGSGGSLTETTETERSSGAFYAVITGTPRPFREPGVDVNDTLPAGSPPDIPRFDDNPERLYVDSDALGGAALDVTSNTTLTSNLGILDYSAGSAALDLDPTTRPTVTGGMVAVPVPAPGTNEFTVSSFNLERFYNSTADTSGAVVITADAYARRLAKASLAIRNVLGTPDILGVDEMENLATLTDLSNKISSDAQAAGQADPQYLPYLVQGNDPSGINVGFLVKQSRVTVTDVTQYGKDATYTNPANGNATELNDRPPLVLHAGVKRASGPDYPVTVIINHLRSLIDVDDATNGPTVRAKREAQAEYLANLIQSFQQNGEHVVSVGDYNAFEFSDGYVDTVGIIRGNPAPADQVVLAGPANLVSPNMVDLATIVGQPQRYSYVEDGSAQVLDHVLVTQDLVSGAHLSYARLNADFPLVDYNDATTPLRVSDHDGAVAYFPIPPPPTPVTLHVSSNVLTYPLSPAFDGTVQAKTGPIPTGSVTIRDSSKSLVTVPVIAGYYFGLVLPPLNVGTHSLTAVYSGDKNYPAGTSAAQAVAIDPAPVTVRLVCSGSTIPSGSSYYCIASAVANNLLPAQGTLTYTIDGQSFSTGLTLGAAILQATRPATGAHTITASFAAQGNYAASNTTSASFVVR